jgi:lysophospholipid acyltransferase (LPLAT)-like uncharacterized protein
MSRAENPSSTVHRVEGIQRAGLHLLGRLVRAWQRSLEYTGLEAMNAVVNDSASGVLFLLWHNRLFPMIGAYREVARGGRDLYGLVSASRDGARLAQFLESQGIRTVRGSSSRRGAVATRELLSVLAAGNHVAITVDGPRGPCYRPQAGAALLLQLTGAPVCFLGAEVEACRELRSWDRFIVPQPFSRVKIKLDRRALGDLSAGRQQRQAIQAMIDERLSRLTGDLHREGRWPPRGGTA